MKLTMCDDDGNPMVSKEIPDPVEIPLMSLRDYFAAAALTGLVGNHEVMRDAIKVEPLMKAEEVAAKLSYRLADAMLKARKP